MTIQDDLRRLAGAASPGPWTTEKPGKDADGFSQGMIIAAVGRGQGIYANPPGGSFPEADRRFIAAANPATIIALCDQLDALQAENSRLSAREDVQLAADALSTTHAENAALAAQLADAVSTIREIAEVGSGYGGRKAEVEKFSYSTTTGEGHQECRDLADAFLAQLDA